MGKRFAIVIGVAAAGVVALGAQTTAAPASSAGKVFKMRVTHTRVVQTESGDYVVKGRVHSPHEGCTRAARMKLRATPDSGIRRATDWQDFTNRRGKFSIRVGQSQEAGTFRVEVGRDDINPEERGPRGLPRLVCDAGKSRRFTLPPPS